MKATYKRLIYAIAMIYMVYVAVPFFGPSMYEQEVLDALSWHGYGGVLDVYGPIPFIIAILLMISLVGLHQFKPWARILFTVVTVISGLATPLWGLQVVGSYDTIFGYFVAIGSGAILSLSYWSELSDEFKQHT